MKINMILLNFVISMLMITPATNNIPEKEFENEYLIAAEMLYRENDTAYFGTCNGQIFCCEDHEEWSDTTEYLLHMDSNGTETFEDDEILVVWRV